MRFTLFFVCILIATAGCSPKVSQSSTTNAREVTPKEAPAEDVDLAVDKSDEELESSAEEDENLTRGDFLFDLTMDGEIEEVDDLANEVCDCDFNANVSECESLLQKFDDRSDRLEESLDSLVNVKRGSEQDIYQSFLDQLQSTQDRVEACANEN